MIYSKLPHFVIGFHGCDISTYENVLYKHKHLEITKNDYDWLGSGIYFWENNLERAWQWAKEKAKRGNTHIKEPAVIGAMIDLGHCLNLLDSQYIDMVKNEYEFLKEKSIASNIGMPENKNITDSTDMILRNLDCAVINFLHEDRIENNEKPFDSVRGMFPEGKPLYKGAGFKDKSHIQIAIRNPNCIKAYFSPFLNYNKEYNLP